MSEQLYGPKIFVGRQEQIELFEQMLQEPQAKWILNLWGRGGIGKTQLLHRFIDIARQRPGVLVTAELIDLYWTAHQRELGILESIARQIAPEQFAPFFAALRRASAHRQHQCNSA